MSRAFDIYSNVLIALICAWTIAFLYIGRHTTAAWSNSKAIKTYRDNTNDAVLALCVSDLIMDLMILCYTYTQVTDLSNFRVRIYVGHTTP